MLERIAPAGVTRRRGTTGNGNWNLVYIGDQHLDAHESQHQRQTGFEVVQISDSAGQEKEQGPKPTNAKMFDV